MGELFYGPRRRIVVIVSNIGHMFLLRDASGRLETHSNASLYAYCSFEDGSAYQHDDICSDLEAFRLSSYSTETALALRTHWNLQSIASWTLESK